MQLPILPGRSTRNSDSSMSSDFSDRRTSVASVTTTTTFPGTRLGSPSLPSLSRARTPELPIYPTADVPDPRSMPALYRDRDRSAYGREPLPLHGGLRQSIESLPPPNQTFAMAPIEPPFHPAYGGGPSHHLPYPDRPPAESSYPREGARDRYPVNFEPAPVDQHRQQHRRRRGNLPRFVTDILRGWFQDHVANPYPTEDEKQMLMDRTGLTISQVSWNLECLILAQRH